MIFYGEKNVYEAAIERFRTIFQQFYGKRKIIVTMSGGKDSTVVLNLAHEVMQEMGIEKIPVLFLDQEAETPQTIEYVRYVMHLPWVEPYWIQSFFKEWNASTGEWFNVFGPGEKWIRPKEPDSYGDLDFGPNNEYFSKTLDKAHRILFGKDYITLGGVRIEESPARLIGLTTGSVEPLGVSWGAGGGFYKDGSAKAMILYPIWDWKLYDVWYYIFSHKLRYCKFYDYQFSRLPLKDCRVSSLIHEQAIRDINLVKEVDPIYYDKLANRVKNVSTTFHSYWELTAYVCNLLSPPPYFKDWPDYVNYLAENLTENPKNAETIKKSYASALKRNTKIFGHWNEGVEIATRMLSQTTCCSILSEDYGMKRLRSVEASIYAFYNNNYTNILSANKEYESKREYQEGI